MGFFSKAFDAIKSSVVKKTVESHAKKNGLNSAETAALVSKTQSSLNSVIASSEMGKRLNSYDKIATIGTIAAAGAGAVVAAPLVAGAIGAKSAVGGLTLAKIGSLGSVTAGIVSKVAPDSKVAQTAASISNVAGQLDGKNSLEVAGIAGKLLTGVMTPKDPALSSGPIVTTKDALSTGIHAASNLIENLAPILQKSPAVKPSKSTGIIQDKTRILSPMQNIGENLENDSSKQPKTPNNKKLLVFGGIGLAALALFSGGRR